MSFLFLSLAFLFTAVPLSSAPAQARLCPAPDSLVFLPCHADVPPMPATERTLPRYPDILRQAGVGGDVHVRYVVDTTGRAVPGTLVVVSSTHDLFALAVKKAVVTWTFAPARRGGAPIAVRYEESFAFRDAPNAPPGTDVAAARDTTVDGIPRTTFGQAIPDPAAVNAYTAEDLKEAQRSVLTLLADKMPPDTRNGPRALCVSLVSDGLPGPSDTETLRRLQAPGRRVVTGRDCPRTYASMIMTVDSLGRPMDPPPPGRVDPHHLAVKLVAPWSRSTVLVEADLGRGMSRTHYRCGANRERGVWVASCRETWRSMS